MPAKANKKTTTRKKATRKTSASDDEVHDLEGIVRSAFEGFDADETQSTSPGE